MHIQRLQSFHMLRRQFESQPSHIKSITCVVILAFVNYLKRGPLMLRQAGGMMLQKKRHPITVVVLIGAVAHGAYGADHVAVLELGGAGE